MLKPSTTLPAITYGADPFKYLALGESVPRGDKRKIMSNSELKKFSSCPSRWVRGHEQKDTDSLEWGSVLDCIVLTPERFESTFAITPETYLADGKKKDDPKIEKPWNWNATACKDWRIEQESKGLKAVKSELCSEAHAAKARLMADPIIRNLLEHSKTQVQICVDWHDAATGIVVPIKCLLDIVPDEGPMLGDLKSATSGQPRQWAKAVHDYGYDRQAALYMDAFNVVTGEKRNTFVHVVQENFSPYEPARRMLSHEYITLGRDRYTEALQAYCQCLKRNEWPGLDEADGMGQILGGWRLVEPEAFMLKD